MDQQVDEEQAAKAAATVLGTEAGKTLMVYLEQITIKRSNMPTQAPDGQAMGMIMAHQEGEKNLVRVLQSLQRKGTKI